MTDLKHKETITKALMEGVNSARKHTDELREQLMEARFGSTHYADLEAQIDCMDDWVVELREALHWLGGQQLAEMRTLTLLPKRGEGGA